MAIKVPKGYALTGKYSWTKAKAEARAKKAKKLGYNVKVMKDKTKRIGKTGYVLVAELTKKGYGWKRRR